MRVIIFANGDFLLPQDILPGDVLIAADGGARHLMKLGLTPGWVIGDMDSLTAPECVALEDAGAKLITYPTRKDETDLELALHKARGFQPEEIVIYAALGARWDMTFANLLLLAHPALSEFNTRLIDGTQELRVLQSGQHMQIDGAPGDTLSLIPLRGDAVGVSTHGLEYALEGDTLIFGAARGVSNVLYDTRATITLRRGLLLVVHIRQDGSVAPQH
ncbi:MAG: thiamine diphosphokinase [Chloroflexi bacterium]|jgi:thiamine pyrophosphokinase|nr:thiamine diphosphokinase [Chloroflexota bacterium]